MAFQKCIKNYPGDIITVYQTNLRRVIKWTKIQTIVHRTTTKTITTITTTQTTQTKTQTTTQAKTQVATQIKIQTRILTTTATKKRKGESQMKRFPFLLTQSLSPLNIERRMQEDKYETI